MEALKKMKRALKRLKGKDPKHCIALRRIKIYACLILLC